MRAAPLFALMLLLAGLLSVPGADALAACGRGETAGAGGVYVVAGGIRSDVWAESNGLAGLQRAACTSGGKDYGPDMMVSDGVPSDLEILGLCAFTPVIAQCF